MELDYKITLGVQLDDEKVPEKLSWEASAQEQPPQEVKAFLLSLFEHESRDTLKIDLWTKDMQVQEMDRFFYQTLRGLADTYQRATRNEPIGNAMEDFAQFFGEKTGIIPVS